MRMMSGGAEDGFEECPARQLENEKAPVSGMREGERKFTRSSRTVNS